MTNPYESPAWEDASNRTTVDGTFHGRGLIGHVRPVGVLMMIQGTMETLMAIFLVFLAFFMGLAFSDMQQNEPPAGNDELSPVMAGWFLGAIYATMALIVAVAAGLHLWAGLRIYQFRSRPWGIAALVAGLLSAGSCYCLPTAVALAIYGMIVLLNASVVEAFQMRTQGQTPDAILLAFEQKG